MQQSEPSVVFPPRPNVLCIAGSDSGGGAGIQADLRAVTAQGAHALTAITALTAQNTRGVFAIHVPPIAFLQAQFDALVEDFEIAAVKIGMLGSRPVIEAVAGLLARLPRVPLVLDPVLVSGTGAALLPDEALAALRDVLLPKATLLTPNLHEAELLLGRRIVDLDALASAAEALRGLGPGAVLLKGGHLDSGDSVVDLLRDAEGETRFTHARLDRRPHGTGCTLASAAAAQLALGRSLRDACERAVGYVHRALASAYRPGWGGLDVLDHFHPAPGTGG